VLAFVLSLLEADPMPLLVAQAIGKQLLISSLEGWLPVGRFRQACTSSLPLSLS